MGVGTRWLILCFCLFSISVHAKDRCIDFVPDVRQAAIQYLGYDYPYWYNIGCMIVESSCRPNLVSFDGGIGLFQLTPSTGITKEISKYIPVDPYNTQSNIRAQAFYISLIKDKKFKVEKTSINKHPISPQKYVKYCGLNLADIYRFYNGGYWFFYEASRKPGVPFVCDNNEMRKYCVRGGVYTDKAKTKWLSFCDVNYSYPEKVYKNSQQYDKKTKTSHKFWHNTGGTDGVNKNQGSIIFITSVKKDRDLDRWNRYFNKFNNLWISTLKRLRN